MATTIRKQCIAEQILFIDGQAGCGKTLLSSVISALDRVELLTYAYEIEMICALYFLNKTSLEASCTQIKLLTDLKIYNLMMGRETNFRPSDLSSVFRYHNPIDYFQRLFQPGDEAIPNRITKNHPILNLATHNLLSVSEPIFYALKSRCVFIEVVRHPLYMIRQQELNMENLLGNNRDFTVNIEYKNYSLPYYTVGFKEDFVKSSSVEKSIRCIYELTKRTKLAKATLKKKFCAQILTIPFEPFVLNPKPWMEKVCKLLGTEITSATRNVMLQQNVPRNKIADGIPLDIYQRCGWQPPQKGASECDELSTRKNEIIKNISKEAIAILDEICHEYETTYWNPENKFSINLNDCQSERALF